MKRIVLLIIIIFFSGCCNRVIEYQRVSVVPVKQVRVAVEPVIVDYVQPIDITTTQIDF